MCEWREIAFSKMFDFEKVHVRTITLVGDLLSRMLMSSMMHAFKSRKHIKPPV